MSRYILVIDQIRSGGAEKILLDYYNYLLKAGNEVAIFSIKKPAKEGFNIDGLNIEYCDNKEGGGTPRTLYTLFKAVFKLRNKIKQNESDIVFSFLEKSNVLTYISTLGLNVKCILTVHNVLSIQYNKVTSKLVKFLLYKTLQFVYCRRKNSVVAVSKQVKDDLISAFSITQDNVDVINNCVDIDAIKILSKSKKDIPSFLKEKEFIFSLGRFSEQKAQHRLIEAYEYCLKHYPDFNANLVIMGEGEKERELRQKISSLNIQDTVFFLPFNSNPYPYFAEASLFCLSSLYEGFPIVIAEACALNIPFVGTEKAIPEEIFSEKSSWSKFIALEHSDALVADLAFLLYNGLYNKKYRAYFYEQTKRWRESNNLKIQFDLYDGLKK